MSDWLDANRGQLTQEGYDFYKAYLNDFTKSQKEVDSAYQQRWDAAGQFETQEAYDKAIADLPYLQKYGGKTYTELRAIAQRMPDSPEKQWLDEYSENHKTKDYYEAEKRRKLSELEYLEKSQADYARLMHVPQMAPNEPGYKELKAEYDVRMPELENLNTDYLIEEKKKEIYHLDKSILYGFLYENKDFEANCGYKGGGTRLQQMVNDPEAANDWDNFTTAAKAAGIPGARLQEAWNYENVHLMEDEERKIFNYLHNTQGEDAAEDYMDWLQYQLNERSKKKLTDWVAKTTGFNVSTEIMASVLSTPIALLSGEGILDAAAQKIIRDFSGEYKPIDYNRDGMFASIASGTIRDTVAQDIAKNAGTGWATGYNIVMGLQDSVAIAAAAKVNPALGKAAAALLSGSAATDTMLNAVERGATDDQAIGLGILSGAFEMFFEKYELDSLLGQSDDVIRATCKQALSEGVGEGATELSNMVADYVIMGKNSNWSANVQSYIDQGFSPEEAKKKAFWDSALQVGMATGGGMVSGGIMGSGQAVIQNASAKSSIRSATAEAYSGAYADAYRDDLPGLVDSALKLDAQNVTALQVQKKLQAGEKISDVELSKAATGRLKELGVEDDVTAVSNAIGKELSGQKLNAIEKELLKNNPQAQQVMDELRAEWYITDAEILQLAKPVRIAEAAGRRLQELGVDQDVGAVSNAIGKELSGQGLTSDEKALLKNHPQAQQVMDELRAEGRDERAYVKGLQKKAIDTYRKQRKEYARAQKKVNKAKYTEDAVASLMEGIEPVKKAPTARDESVAVISDLVDETVAQLTGAPSDPLKAAVEGFRTSGTVSNKQATDILNNAGAVEQLVQETGMVLPATASGKRAAVKEAVAKLGSREMAVDSGADVGYDKGNTIGGVEYGEGSQFPGQTGEAAGGNQERPVIAPSTDGNRSGIPGALREDGGTYSEDPSSPRLRRITAGSSDFSDGDYAVVAEDSPLHSITREFAERGIQCRVIKDAAWTRKAPAYAKDGQVYIRESIDADTLSTTVPHETCHVMKQRHFQPYLDFTENTPDALNIHSEYFRSLAQLVAKHLAIDPLDGDNFDLERFYDELNSIVYGLYKSGILDNTEFEYGDYMPHAFKDFAGYIQELDRIHEQFKAEGTASTESVGAAPEGFTGKGDYYDLMTDENAQPDRPGDVRPMEVPKTDANGRRVSEFAANAYGSALTSDYAADTVQELIMEGALGFDVKGHAQSLAQAQERIQRDGDKRVLLDIKEAVGAHKTTDEDIAAAILLYSKYAKSKDTQTEAAEILTALGEMANRTGRNLSLFALMRKMTGQGQLATLENYIRGAQRSLNRTRSKKKQLDVQIPQELKDKFLKAAQDEQNGVEGATDRKDEVTDLIFEYAASQMKATVAEKANAWRYMAMLGNPVTQARNIIGNVAMKPMVGSKRIIGSVLEGLFLKKEDRTKSILVGKDARELKAWARADTNNAKEALMASGRTGDKGPNQILDQRQIYNNPYMEAVRNFVQLVPETMDMAFKNWEYSTALASFIKARGYTAADAKSGKIPEATLAQARSYAVQEALKATFNDCNALSDLLTSLGRRSNNQFAQAANLLVEGVLPFRKTPANILSRAIADYSPVGIARGLGNLATQVRKGNMSAATAIDKIASGLTGTGLMALGYALSKGLLGIRLVGKLKDEDEKDSNRQSYALEIGDHSFSIDWAAPVCIPLFVGANLGQADEETDSAWWVNALNVCATSVEPMLELSCLSALNDLAEDVKYAEQGEAIYSAAASIATSYVSQFFPSALGQWERALEEDEMKVYSDAESGVEKTWQRFIGGVSKKIPGWDAYQVKKYDDRGDDHATENRVNSIVKGIGLLPSDIQIIDSDAVHQEISRLNDEQDVNVSLPSAHASVSYMDASGEKQERRLTHEEYETVSRVQGQEQDRLLQELFASEGYGSMNDAQKAAAVEDVYAYAKEMAYQEAIADYQSSADSWMLECEGREVEAIVTHTVTSSLTKAMTAVANGGKDAVKAAEDAYTTYAALPQFTRMAVDKELGGRSEAFVATQKAGVSAEAFGYLYGEYQQIDQSDLSASGKAQKWAYALDGAQKQGRITAAQKKVLKDGLKFYMTMAADSEKYDRMTAAGVSSQTADYVWDLLSGIEPEAGKDNVRDIQRMEAIVEDDRISDEDIRTG